MPTSQRHSLASGAAKRGLHIYEIRMCGTLSVPPMLTRTEHSPAPSIRTPEQRLRVFVSSTLGDLAPERRAARDAITALHLTPVFFEAGARRYPAREVYRAYLAQSDIFVGIYWQSYGALVPTMGISGLEDEYQLSSGKHRLIYIKQPAPERNGRLQALLDGIRQEDVTKYQKFSTAAELWRTVRGARCSLPRVGSRPWGIPLRG